MYIGQIDFFKIIVNITNVYKQGRAKIGVFTKANDIFQITEYSGVASIIDTFEATQIRVSTNIVTQIIVRTVV